MGEKGVLIQRQKTLAGVIDEHLAEQIEIQQIFDSAYQVFGCGSGLSSPVTGVSISTSLPGR